MPGFTNRGNRRLDELAYSGVWRDRNGNPVAVPTNWYIALVLRSGAQPGPDTNLLSELTQPTTGGYVAGGNAVPRSSVGFPTYTEDDALDKSVAAMLDQTFAATGADIIAVSALVMTDDAATVGDRQVISWFDLVGGDHTIANGTSTQFKDLKLESQST